MEHITPTQAGGLPTHRFHPLFALPLVLALAVAPLSCENSDLQIPPPDPAVQWNLYAQVYCQRLAACCGAPTQLFDEPNCVDDYLRRVIYESYTLRPMDPWKLQRCLEKRRARLALGCDAEISLRIDDCLNLIDRPESNRDSQCGEDRDCPRDQYCSPDGCAGGKCAPRLGEGQSCDGNGAVNRACRDGLTCSYLPDTSGDSVCTQPQEFMQECLNHTDCGSHYDRRVACVGGRCSALLEEGQPCVPWWGHLQCASGFCDPDTSLCAPLTFRQYCENRSTLQWVYDGEFDRNYSRY